MKKKILLLLSIIFIITVVCFFYKFKRNDSYKRIINLFDEIKNEEYLGYFYRYHNLEKNELENKIKLSIAINEVFLTDKKEIIDEDKIKKVYETLFGLKKYKNENTFYKDKTVLYKDKKYYLIDEEKDTLFKLYTKEIKKENGFFRYVELQYHGDITLDDVNEICFTKDLPEEDIIKILKDKNIKLFRLEGGKIVKVF